jgi:hypothetical protein
VGGEGRRGEARARTMEGSEKEWDKDDRLGVVGGREKEEDEDEDDVEKSVKERWKGFVERTYGETEKEVSAGEKRMIRKG